MSSTAPATTALTLDEIRPGDRFFGFGDDDARGDRPVTEVRRYDGGSDMAMITVGTPGSNDEMSISVSAGDLRPDGTVPGFYRATTTTPSFKLTLVPVTTVLDNTAEVASGKTLLFRDAHTAGDAVACVVWEHVAGREAFADVAVETQPKSRLFAAPTLAGVLLLAFEWAEQEATR